jgi:hypothetical protein
MKLKRMKAIIRKTIGQNKYCQHNFLFVAEGKILHIYANLNNFLREDFKMENVWFFHRWAALQSAGQPMTSRV